MRGMGVRMCASTAFERFGSNSLSFQAKLFYEEHHLRMATTRSIRHGEQIVRFTLPVVTACLRETQWNTYGDPPNSDLLRRYGHVDQVPLANGGLGNPADIVEIRADHLMQIVQHKHPQQTGPWTSERVNWWLEEGGDECILLSTCYLDSSHLVLHAASLSWTLPMNYQKRWHLFPAFWRCQRQNGKRQNASRNCQNRRSMMLCCLWPLTS